MLLMIQVVHSQTAKTAKTEGVPRPIPEEHRLTLLPNSILVS